MAELEQLEANAGTYLTFLLDKEEYGIDILRVLEIIKYMAPTEIPGSPDEMIGVINLRGQVIPVISMRKRFGFEIVEKNEKNVIIVVESEMGKIGFSVDQVQEVITFASQELEAAPDYGLDIDTSYITSIAKTGEHVRILLDVSKILSKETESAMHQSSSQFGEAANSDA